MMAVLVMICATLTAAAQTEQEKKQKYYNYPYMFVGVQGGVQTMFTPMGLKKNITPIGQLSFGAYFSPVVGARLTGSGIWTKAGLPSIDKTYEYNHFTGNLDLLINLSNLFTGRQRCLFNAVLIGGVGVTYGWNNKLGDFSGYTEDCSKAWADDMLSHNLRLAMQFNFDLGKYIDVNLEAGANALSDRFNSKASNSFDWQGYAMVGLAVKFGHRKVKEEPVVVPVPVPVVEEIWETRVDTIWYNEKAYKDVEVAESFDCQVHFPLRGFATNESAQAEMNKVAEFIKSHRDVKIDVKAYADKGTGTPRINKKYSEQRRKGTVDAIVALGVDPSVITSESFGDTVQPFPTNDENRVSIVTVSGIGTKKEPYNVRKFRTEEKRVRVQ